MPKKIDWFYHRKHCVSCQKAESYLDDQSVQVASETDARKTPLNRQQALALVKEVETIVAAKGKSIVTLKMKDKPKTEAILSLLLGPTGNLRAPTFRKGKTLVVGFLPELYDHIFG